MNSSFNSEHNTEINSVKTSRNKNIVIGVLIAAIVVLAGFLIFNNNQTKQTLVAQQTEIGTITSEKSELQSSFDASLSRLDSMATSNTNLQNQLTAKDGEIAKIKSEIRSILNKKDATTAELNKARKLIEQLNGQIQNLETQIANLTLQNDSLKTDRVNLIADKQVLTRHLDSTIVIKRSLEEKVEVASTLNASNITITPLKIKSNGKEKVKTSAKQVDKLLVKFDVNNRIITPGTTNIYVVIIGPDGQPIRSAGTESFKTREEGEKYFTAMLPVDLQTATTKNIEFSFAPTDHFKEGNYKVQIYQNGFLIGEGNRELTKGGLFG